MCEKKSADESREENSAKTECMWKHVHEKMAKMNLNFMKTARRTCIFFFFNIFRPLKAGRQTCPTQLGFW